MHGYQSEWLLPVYLLYTKTDGDVVTVFPIVKSRFEEKRKKIKYKRIEAESVMPYAES